ncbi:hypothetical protein FACS1894187_11150 [Synergistales bacterium]|nr:hypothetical protein FACS1894187_11150 [Synergistales bacterium]
MHNISPVIKDNDGKTALDYARENTNLKDTEVITQLRFRSGVITLFKISRTKGETKYDRRRFSLKNKQK